MECFRRRGPILCTLYTRTQLAIDAGLSLFWLATVEAGWLLIGQTLPSCCVSQDQGHYRAAAFLAYVASRGYRVQLSKMSTNITKPLFWPFLGVTIALLRKSPIQWSLGVDTSEPFTSAGLVFFTVLCRKHEITWHTCMIFHENCMTNGECLWPFLQKI